MLHRPAGTAGASVRGLHTATSGLFLSAQHKLWYSQEMPLQTPVCSQTYSKHLHFCNSTEAERAQTLDIHSNHCKGFLLSSLPINQTL